MREAIDVAVTQPRFNPLPSPKQGETQALELYNDLLDRFNPLPSPKQGETAPRRRALGEFPCFNPLPSPKQGETSLIGGILTGY